MAYSPGRICYERKKKKMTELEIKSTMEEANEIADGKRSYLIRGKRLNIGVEDIVTIVPMRDKKRMMHRITKNKYRVTHISGCAPIDTDFKIISLKQI